MYSHFWASRISTANSYLGIQKNGFIWKPIHEEAFNRMKKEFLSPSVLSPHDPSRPVEMETDASDLAFSGIIMQSDANGCLEPITFFAHKFTPQQRNWPTTHRELYAIRKKYVYIRHSLYLDLESQRKMKGKI
jgi:hypothetical protein